MAKILIIDDEKTILNNLQFILEMEGYDVITSSSGQDGISRFLEFKDIDAVITDMRMPGLCGLDVIKAIRQQDAEIGIIVMTGDGDINNAIEAMKEGAFDYLNKPINADKLILCIENAIEKYNLVKENQKLNEDIRKKNIYFQNINDAASQILLNMAPKNIPEFDALKHYAIYESCDLVGGDMYDIFPLGKKYLFYIFDVCGHGILSAVMTMILKSSFNNLKFLFSQTGIIPDIEDIVKTVNEEMYTSTSPNLFATLFVGYYDPEQHEIHYISAGHVDQYLVTNERIKTLCSTGTVIGIFNETSFTSEKIKVNPSDRLYLFTDGVTEVARGGSIQANEDIMRIIRDMHNTPLEETVTKIIEEITGFYCSNEPDDDMTIVGLEFKKTSEVDA